MTAPATLDKVQALAIDLNTGFPRSPRATIGGFILAGRALDKCRATIVGQNGEYHFACPLDKIFFDFAGIDPEAFKAFVATGATDDEVGAWVLENTTKKDRAEVIRWNNAWREKKLSDLDDRLQGYMEDYVRDFCPPNARIYVWFDVYDYEEKRFI